MGNDQKLEMVDTCREADMAYVTHVHISYLRSHLNGEMKILIRRVVRACGFSWRAHVKVEHIDCSHRI